MPDHGPFGEREWLEGLRDEDKFPDPDLPYHLRLDAPPLAVCNTCLRKSWADGERGEPCGMPQPDGSNCRGTMLRA